MQTRRATSGSDNALYAILGSNLLTLAIAWWQDWGLLHLLWPFWLQSVVIGWYARRRILALREFSAAGAQTNSRSVEATPEIQRWTANFFALHYGFFHLMYFFFLLIVSTTADAGGLIEVTHSNTGKVSIVHVGRIVGVDLLAFALIGYAFWRSHRLSHREHVASDLARRPNTDALMKLPYARVLPMHLCIILGVALPSGMAIWLFGALKIAADLTMHKVEHAWLARSAPR